MRIHIAMMLSVALAVSSAPAMAQDNSAAATANAANVAAPAPADANMVAMDVNAAIAEMPAPNETAIDNDAAAMPEPAPKSRPFPWGIIGLVGLIGLMGRRRG